MNAVQGAFRSALLDLTPADRPERLLTHLQESVGQVLGRPAESLRPDLPVPLLDVAWRVRAAAYISLRHIVEAELGLVIYPVELSLHPTLASLADYLAREIDPPDAGVPALVEDPYEGGRWAWGEPTGPEDDAAQPRLPSIAFVLSSPRAGSTLFRLMLDSHTRLFSPPELNLLPFRAMGERRRALDAFHYGWMRWGPEIALAEAEGLHAPDATRELERLERSNTRIPDVYRRLQQGAKGRLLVDKSPTYAMHRGWLDRAERLFEQPRYLFLVRHPYAVMESFVRMRFPRVLGPHWLVWDDHVWRYAEKVWASCNRHVLDFLSGNPPGSAGVEPARALLVRYEELVAEPERVTAEVCTFLGLPTERAMTEPYDRSRSTRLSSPGGAKPLPTIGDPNQLLRSAVDRSLADAWREHRPPQELGPFTRRVAEELGYNLDD